MIKKASSEWTVSKLLTFILIIVFLVLVIWGISKEALNPLIDKTSNFASNVANKIGLGHDYASGNSFRVDIPGVGKGNMTISENECKLDLDGNNGSYRLDVEKGNLEGWNNYVEVKVPGVTGHKDSCFMYDSKVGKWKYALSGGGSNPCENIVSAQVYVPEVIPGIDDRTRDEIVKVLEGKDYASGIGLFDSKNKDTNYLKFVNEKKTGWIGISVGSNEDSIEGRIKSYLESRC